MKEIFIEVILAYTFVFKNPAKLLQLEKFTKFDLEENVLPSILIFLFHWNSQWNLKPIFCSKSKHPNNPDHLKINGPNCAVKNSRFKNAQVEQRSDPAQPKNGLT